MSSLSGSGNVNLNGNTLTIGNIDGASGSFSGTVSGSSTAAIVVNYGSTALTGPNTFGGGTTVNSGTLNIGGSTTPAGTNSSISLAGGTLGLIGQGPTLSNPTQTYAYNVPVSADSGVNVSGSPAATLGNLTIGSNSLTVNSPDSLGGPYSLTFAGNSGVTNLTGNPTFIANNSD